MNRISKIVSFAAGCALAIAIAAPARAATANVDQRAVKFGTTLPATCWTGDIFFKTDATAGSNLYACVALNTWVVQGGSTVVNGGDATGFAETRTSNTVMTTSLIAGTVNVKFGTVVQSIGAGGTVTLGTSSCSGGGLAWQSVTPSGVLEIDANTNVNLANVTVSGFVKGSNTATGTPNGNFPLYRLSCGNSAADQWDSNMILDLRATYAQKNVAGGTFVIPTEGPSGTTSLDIDPTRLQGSDPNLLTAGNVSGTGATLCTDANGGATTSGCSGGGGGGATTVAIDTDFFAWKDAAGIFGISNANVTNTSGGIGLGDAGAIQMSNTGAPFIVFYPRLPLSWTGAVDIRILWVGFGGGGNVGFNIYTWCVGSGGAVITPSYNSPQSTSPQAVASYGVEVETVQTALTVANCTAGQQMQIKVARDNTVASNYPGVIGALGATVTVRHTLP
jgi:hypothetical protein